MQDDTYTATLDRNHGALEPFFRQKLLLLSVTLAVAILGSALLEGSRQTATPRLHFWQPAVLQLSWSWACLLVGLLGIGSEIPQEACVLKLSLP